MSFCQSHLNSFTYQVYHWLKPILICGTFKLSALQLWRVFYSKGIDPMMPNAAQAYQSLQAYKPRSNQDVLGEAETKYGLPEARTRLSSLRGLVGNLQSSVEAVDPSVTGRTSGSFVTEGQRQALVSKERAPILGDLSKQQGALGQEEASYNTSSTLASQMASALMAQDQQTYQRLLDQYNAAVASEREAEAKRQWEAQMAEQKRQFNEQQKTSRAAAGGAGGYNLASLLGGGSAKTTSPAQDNIKTKAVSDVGQLFQRQGQKSFYDEITAIYKSAGYGNTYDQAKLELIKSKIPEFFKKNGAPKYVAF
jgi:hypothetical protein